MDAGFEAEHTKSLSRLSRKVRWVSDQASGDLRGQGAQVWTRPVLGPLQGLLRSKAKQSHLLHIRAEDERVEREQ